ncbi:VQ motif-containing protein 20-like [Coffea arabica]|uniref:VQ motif-containing protein 20-like n=1 Tax=Coffea arabica TaxID=13443 RepID=A0A6P6X959_COFAR
MSAAHFSHQHAKKEMIALSPLKINRDSHFIKKSSPSSSSSSSSSSLVNKPAQQRHPVIIYTHSPKVIHTHPKDFMALVQKLTGLSRSSEDDQIISPAPPPPPETKVEPNFQDDFTDDNNNKNMMVNNDNKGGTMNDDNESTSVVTDEIENNGSSGTTAGDIGQVNSSCFVTPPPPIFDPPNPCFNNIPFFNPSPATDFFCTAQPFYNYSDSLFFMPNIRSSLSSATLDGMKELPDF